MDNNLRFTDARTANVRTETYKPFKDCVTPPRCCGALVLSGTICPTCGHWIKPTGF